MTLGPSFPDEPGVVLNPEAIGNPDIQPVVLIGDAPMRILRPCDANSPSHDGYCGGVNGFHAEDCERQR